MNTPVMSMPLIESQDEAIHQHKQAEDALCLSEAKFSQIFYYNQAMMAIVKAIDNTFIDINNAALSTFGYHSEEIIGKSIFELNLWVEAKEREEILKKINKSGIIKDFACKFRNKNNETVYMFCTANYINIGEENCILVSALDITSHKKAEEALRLSEELFHKTFNFNPIAMVILTSECNKILKSNESFRRITESNMREEFPELEVDKDIWVDIKEREYFLTEILREGIVRNHEVKLRKKSGDVAIVLLSGVFINWKKEECILLAVNDITELRSYQNKMAWLDRLRLIGVTSAGIAHEIRNPLTTVKGFLQLFMEKERYIEDRGHLKLMIEEIDKANLIITDFLSLGNSNAVNLKRQNLNTIIKEVFPLLQVEAVKDSKFIQMKLGEIVDLVLDREDIGQLIKHLVHNGLDAMLAGGHITIKTFMRCNKVILAIQDQGKGIRPEFMDKIGMPFFTTKDHGTGLSLAFCYNIANRNNARIEFDTGQMGTELQVIFSLF